MLKKWRGLFIGYYGLISSGMKDNLYYTEDVVWKQTTHQYIILQIFMQTSVFLMVFIWPDFDKWIIQQIKSETLNNLYSTKHILSQLPECITFTLLCRHFLRLLWGQQKSHFPHKAYLVSVQMQLLYSNMLLTAGREEINLWNIHGSQFTSVSNWLPKSEACMGLLCRNRGVVV